jgi:hypothetical protein
MHVALLTSGGLTLLAGAAGLVLLRGVPKVLADDAAPESPRDEAPVVVG